MKKVGFVAAALVLGAALVLSQSFTYVGADKCGICHKTPGQGRQLPIWQGSKHAQSFAVLEKPETIEKTKASGIARPSEEPRCQACHVPLADKAPGLKSEGVTCEVCHGPGSEYKKLSLMKNREEAVKNGLILHPHADAVKAACLKCHDKAHGKEFDFAAAWDKIKHPIPEKN